MHRRGRWKFYSLLFGPDKRRPRYTRVRSAKARREKRYPRCSIPPARCARETCAARSFKEETRGHEHEAEQTCSLNFFRGRNGDSRENGRAHSRTDADAEVLPVARNLPPRLICSGNGRSPLAIFGLTKSDTPAPSLLAPVKRHASLLIPSSSFYCFIIYPSAKYL